MPLTLWTENGSGYRSPAFFARIARSLKHTDHPALYIVPNATWKLRAESLCLPHCGGILFGERITTLSLWVERIAAADDPAISPDWRLQVVAPLMSKLPLEYFRGAKSAETVVTGIVAALAAGISPPQLTSLASDFGQEREQDLAQVVAAYIAELAQMRRVDPAQFSLLAAQALLQHCPLTHHRYIIDTGNTPPAALWQVLRHLVAHSAAPDVHVIVPEILRHRAEAQLGIAAQPISAEEWISTSPAPTTLYRAPHPTAQYHWMAEHLRTLHRQGTTANTIAVICCDPDPTFWLEACVSAGLLPTHASPQSLAASPISATWYSDAVWKNAPATAPIAEWTQWWKARLASPSRIQALTRDLPHSAHAARALQDLARWEKIWMYCAAHLPPRQRLTPHHLQTLIAPLLQNNSGRVDMSAAATALTPHDHVGDRLSHLAVLDATQDMLPRISPSPFFKLAASFPQDTNAQTLMMAFPNSEQLIQSQMAAWQRLQGCSESVIGIFSQGSDSHSEVAPSLFFTGTIHDIPAGPTEPLTANRAPHHFLNDADTIAHVRARLQDHTFSVTELEDFAQCPFRHFARYILGIMVPDEETPEISARDEGKIIHRLLEQYYRSPIADLLSQPCAERTAIVRQRLHNILAHDIKTTTPLHQIQTDRLLTLGTAVILRDLVDAERLGTDALQPAHLEWKFGYNDVPPLELQDHSGHRVTLRGKIDRLDRHPDTKRLLLIDYKHRKTESIIGDIQKGLHLQIPLYLMAAQKIFSDHLVLGGLLYDLPKLERRHGLVHKEEAEFLAIPGRPKSLVKAETWGHLLDTAAQFAVHYATQIRAADLPIPPHSCEYCDWKDLLPWEKNG